MHQIPWFIKMVRILFFEVSGGTKGRRSKIRRLCYPSHELYVMKYIRCLSWYYFHNNNSEEMSMTLTKSLNGFQYMAPLFWSYGCFRQ